MTKYYYDLHIHSALSPCADDDMTPYNIVNMAKLCGLDVIALTDHNSCKNTSSFIEVAKSQGIVALAGMELCCAEECHVVCLFPNVDIAMEFDKFVYNAIPDIDNNPEIFGNQLVFDAQDNVFSTERKMLTTASTISVDNIAKIVKEYNGAAFPAHIDRPSYSVIISLGTVPNVGFKSAEITGNANVEEICQQHKILNNMNLLLNSDAHSLGLIQDAKPWVCLEKLSPESVIEALNDYQKSTWGRN